MKSIEKTLSEQNAERARNHPEFLRRKEREATFDVLPNPITDLFRGIAEPYESIYLDEPVDKEFSVRLRTERDPDGNVRFVAGVKNDGEMKNGALERLQIETEVSEASAGFYADNPYRQFMDVKYDRAELTPGIDIDFVEDRELPLLEYESQADDPEPGILKVLRPWLVDRSDDPTVRKKSLARQKHPELAERAVEPNEQFAHRVMANMVASYATGLDQVVVGISGMSGSGKSSIVREIVAQFQETYGSEFAPIVLSSDDYHRGKRYLEETYGAPWTNWDDPRVYDTAALAQDLQRLKSGEPILRRHFDFATEEVIEDGIEHPKPFVIVEGLYAGSPDLNEVRTLHYEVPTGIATSIGRDIRRLVLENRANASIGTPEDRLRYVIEVALPTYLAQERPKRNSFSAHSRPLAERAFLLKALEN